MNIKKFFLVLFTGLLLSVELPAQSFSNSLNKALKGLTQDSQQRNSYNKSLRSSYERWQKKENDKKKNKDKENGIDNENRTTSAIKKEPETTMLKEERTSVQKQELTTAPQRKGKVVSLAVSGTGQTKEEAVKNALRSAIEQAFGSFVSANTEVLNDDLVKDEIVTVSSGNILHYKELYSTSIGNNYSISLLATVSIGNLISYAQNKGMKAELAGATFAMNMKLRRLNKENELKAMENLKRQLCLMAKSGLFDFKIGIREPYMRNPGSYWADGKLTQDKNRNIAVNVRVKQVINSKTIEFRNAILRVLLALGLTDQEKGEYDSAGIPYYFFCEAPNGGYVYLRNKYNRNAFMDILTIARNFFSIRDNLGHILSPYMRVYEGKFYKYEWNGPYLDGGMYSDLSKIYYSNGKEKAIVKKSTKSFADHAPYKSENILHIPDHNTAYENVNYLLETGISSDLIFEDYTRYNEPRREYNSFMSSGANVGENFSKTQTNLLLFYTSSEIEKLNSIQVDPILSNFELERLIKLY